MTADPAAQSPVNAAGVKLTEAEIRSVDDSLYDDGCHGFVGDHPRLYAAVESLIAARVDAVAVRLDAAARAANIAFRASNRTDYFSAGQHQALVFAASEIRAVLARQGRGATEVVHARPTQEGQ